MPIKKIETQGVSADRIKKLNQLIVGVMVDPSPSFDLKDMLLLADMAMMLTAYFDKGAFHAKSNDKTYDFKKTSQAESVQYLVDFFDQYESAILAIIAKLKANGDETMGYYDGHDEGLLVVDALTELANALYINPQIPEGKKEEGSPVLLYRAKGGELAIRFTHVEARDRVAKAIGVHQIPKQFVDPSAPQFSQNPHGTTPAKYSDNLQCLFFPAYQAKQNEFAINLVSKRARNQLIQELGFDLNAPEKKIQHKNGQIESQFGNGFFKLFDDANETQSSALYFTPSNPIFNTSGTCLSLTKTNAGVKIEMGKRSIASPKTMTTTTLLGDLQQTNKRSLLGENVLATFSTKTGEQTTVAVSEQHSTFFHKNPVLFPAKLDTESIDLRVYPGVKFAAVNKNGGQVTLGDLHANPLKLIHYLFRYGVADFIENAPVQYQMMVQLLTSKAPSDWDKNDLATFKKRLSNMTFNQGIFLRLIGDETGDRVGNDFIILLILQALKQNGVQYEVMISNHGAEFIGAYENYKVNKKFTPPLLRGDFVYSTYCMNQFINNQVITSEEVFHLIETCYKPMLRLISYSAEEKYNGEDRFVLFCHAPLPLKGIHHIALALGVEPKLKNHAEIADTIKAINEAVQKHIQANTFYAFANQNNAMQAGYHGVINMETAPVAYVLWSRQYSALVDLMAQKIVEVHGHDSTLHPFTSFVLTTDSSHGKVNDELYFNLPCNVFVSNGKRMGMEKTLAPTQGVAPFSSM